MTELWRNGMFSLAKQTLKWEFTNVLDIGTGDGLAAKFFYEQGKQVAVTGYDMSGYLATPLPNEIIVHPNLDICDMSEIPDSSFDAVWCSHVLEHVQNVGRALSEIRRILKPKGMLFLIVPEYAPVLVGGHISTGWSVGTLIYNLLINGFNSRDGEFINHCWNVAAFVERGDLPGVKLRFDKGDLETLAPYFPPQLCVSQGMNANKMVINWKWKKDIEKEAAKEFGRVIRHRMLIDLIPPCLLRIWRERKQP